MYKRQAESSAKQALLSNGTVWVESTSAKLGLAWMFQTPSVTLTPTEAVSYTHLNISPNTVKRHISLALQKLNIRHRQDLKKFMLR